MNITNIGYVIPMADIKKFYQDSTQLSKLLIETGTTLNKINEEMSKKSTSINKEFNAGTRFTYQGLEWVALDEVNGGVLAITSKLTSNFAFDTYNKNNWKISTLRHYLNHVFLKNFDTNDLIIQSLDLTSDDGMKNYGTCEDYIGLLSCDQYRKYRDILPKYDSWWWTITPWTCDVSNAHNVRAVHTTGTVNYGTANNAIGVSPVCIFKSEIYNACR